MRDRVHCEVRKRVSSDARRLSIRTVRCRRLLFEVLEDRRLLAAVPQMVRDINPSGAGSSPGDFIAVGNWTYFYATDGTHGPELWKSDGTAAGTAMVKDINPGSVGSGPRFLTNVNGTLFFCANDGTHGRELWKSDGTADGTVMVKDIVPGGGLSDLFNLTNVDGNLFFRALDTPYGSTSVHGYELWKSDGTEAGTVMVKDIYPGGAGSYPTDLLAIKGTLFFIANDGIHGGQLWRSDGSEAGTVMVKDIKPVGGSSISDLTVVGDTLFFNDTDPANSVELWKSDGTDTGTVMVKVINPGPAISYALENLTNVNGTLFFARPMARMATSCGRVTARPPGRSW